jgi:prevent-host-death family protein
MQTIPLAKAKAELSHLIDLACRGEEVVITRRGQAVARLVGERPAKTAAEAFASVWAAGGLNLDTPTDLPVQLDSPDFDA